MNSLTTEQKLELKEAVYMISDAFYKLKDLNDEVKNPDIGALLENLETMCEQEAGGIGYFTKVL